MYVRIYRHKVKVKTAQTIHSAEKTVESVYIQSPKANNGNINIIKNVFVSDIIGNEYDWFVMINYRDETKKQEFSNSFQSFANAHITLNGAKIDVSELRKGDNLEIGYAGKLSNNRITSIPDIKYVSVLRQKQGSLS